MGEVIRNLSTIGRRLTGIKPAGHGPYHEATDGWVDPKPYSEVHSNGLFEGYDHTLWLYFGFPRDVKTEWNKNPLDAMHNQHFFVEMIDRLASNLDNVTDKTVGDERRMWHMQITPDTFTGIQPFVGATPAMKDYLSRMSERYTKPIWNGYFGVQLIPSQAFSEAYGWTAKFERYIEMMREPEALRMHLYSQDISDITGLMGEHGFRPLDFATREGKADYERLTAWHGISDDAFLMPKQLEVTRMMEPVHGNSVITPRWGEIGMYAIKPRSLFMVDPISEAARWSKPLYGPDGNVVVINMRGEIRSARVAENMFDSKRLVKGSATERRNHKNAPVDEREKDQRMMSQLDRARAASSGGHGMLDNVEIVVGATITPGRPNPLNKILAPHNLQAVPLTNRQAIAVNNTFPTYPKPLFPVKRNNNTRSPMSNQMYAGAIAMSGLFRHTKAAAPGGLLLGLSDGTSEYNEIYTDVEGANKRHKTPGMLVTGRPGAGKTQSLLQMVAQAAYQGYRTVYLNPKKTGTLAPAFTRLGGTVINMGNQYLAENPGMMDPVFYIADRKEVASILNQAIQMATQMNEEKGQESQHNKSRLAAELVDNSTDLRNKCAGHIIFGNPTAGTTGITDERVKEIIQNKMRSSAFWKAFISMTESVNGDMLQEMLSGKPLLIEWDKSMSPPSQEDLENGKITDEQMDSIISINIAFRYGVEIAGSGRAGGAIFIDEAWVLKSSQQSMRLVEGGLREFREANIMLVLGTQRLRDFMEGESSDMTTFFDRFLIMAISANDKKELDKFYELTGLPRDEYTRRYIVEAGVESEDDDPDKRRQIRTMPRAYYIDRIYNFEGGILCGPFPLEELNAGRSDKKAGDARNAAARAEAEDHMSSMFGGVLMDTIEQDRALADVTDES